ncbi:MAG: DUF58 domain-containing protein [Betaproteobacteria bacterium]|nr:DUF58 domain-containing protein [Betaproteobacteria bacterium]
MWRSFYLMFRAISAVGSWVERRFTRAGLLALGALVLAGAFGADTSLTVAYRIFTFLAALIALAMVGSWFGTPALAVRPRLPHTLTAGEPFDLRFEVRNASARLVDGVALQIALADSRPTLSQFRSQLKFPTYQGWARLGYANRVAQLAEVSLPPMPAHAHIEIEARGQALRRGRLRIERIDSARAEPLGLMRRLVPAAGGADICVLPKRYPLPPIALPGARRYQPGGMPQGSSVGDSEEFLGLRDYRPGDPLQRIHWRSFARAGRPVVKEYQDEFVARHALVLDTFARPGDEPAFEEAVAVAASFAWTIDTQECLLDLMFVGEEIHTYTAGHGYMLPGRLLEVLSGVAVKSDGDFRVLVEAVRARCDLLSGCVCILLGWDEKRRALLEMLNANGATVLPLLVSASAPADLPARIRRLEPGKIAEGLALL